MRVVSGGQTGVDRAALDAAMALGIPCGGWCPKGRKAEDGPIASRYPLTETPSETYAQRTEWNVRDADGTLALVLGGPLTGGTAETVEHARRLGRPYLVLDVTQAPAPAVVAAWVERYGIRTLNVAGPRESKAPGMYRRAAQWLRETLILLRQPP